MDMLVNMHFDLDRQIAVHLDEMAEDRAISISDILGELIEERIDKKYEKLAQREEKCQNKT